MIKKKCCKTVLQTSGLLVGNQFNKDCKKNIFKGVLCIYLKNVGGIYGKIIKLQD